VTSPSPLCGWPEEFIALAHVTMHVVSPRRRNTFSAHVAVKCERRNCIGYGRVVLSISGDIGRWMIIIDEKGGRSSVN